MRFRILLILVALAVFAADKAQCQADLSVRITYVGNEGVLIESGDKKVLIDGLHRQYKPAYLHLPESELKKAERGEAPFDNIDYLLVTHIHRDHFSAESVGNYLLNNPETTLVASRQVADTLLSQFPDPGRIMSRISTITPALGEKGSISKQDIEINVLRMDHGSRRFSWIQNLGFVVTIGGETILHIGDAAMSKENFIPLNLTDKNIDVALLPYWYFLYESGQQIINNHIRARHYMAIHIDPRKKEEDVQRLGEAFPGVVPLVDLYTMFPRPE